jgi:DNA-binding MarR family transcriptional regulator
MLRDWDAKAFDLIQACANNGDRAPTCDELVDATGASCVATTVNIVKRLERLGLIQVDRYQRERRITVTATGKSTAPVKTKTPHWRSRPRPVSMPSISVTYVQQRAARNRREQSIAEQFSSAAHAEGLSVQDFIAELIWAGWQVRTGE